MNNLKTIFLSGIITCLSLGLNAQLNFDGGVKVNAITSQVHGDGHSGFNKIGISGGFFVDLDFNDSGLDLMMEILYSQKGSRNKPDTENGDFSYYRLKLDYIEIPLTVHYELKGLELELGLYYGYLLNSSEDTGFGEGSLANPYRNYDVGAHCGISYYFGESNFFFNARVANSILSTRKAPPVAVQPGVAWDGGGFNSSITGGLGYRF